MTWQRIAHQDAFLAGAIAARGVEPWEETTAEQERKTQVITEYDKMSAGYEKGDPARWEIKHA